MVGIFHGQLLLRAALGQQCRQVDGLSAWFYLGERQCDGDVLRIGQDGQIVLLTVGEAVASGQDLADEER